MVGKGPLGDFHNKTERFFQKRKDEATLSRAIGVLLLATLILSLVSIFSDYDWDYGIILMSSQLQPIINQTISNSFALLGMVFLPVVFLVWAFGTQLFGGKGSFIQVTYLVMIPTLVVAVFFFVASIITALWCLGILLFVLVSYLSFVAIKTALGLSYAKSIMVLIIAQMAAGIVAMALFMGYLVLFINPHDIGYMSNMTNNSDGTTTFSYAYYYKTSGEITEYCEVTFPEGWKQADDRMKDIIEVKIDRIDDLPASKTVYYKNDEEFLFFVYGLPLSSSNLGGIKSCSNASEDDYWFEKGFSPDYTTAKSNLHLIEASTSTICDKAVQNQNKTIIRHTANGVFIGNKIRFEAVYQSPVGEDQDLDFILNNIKCHNY